MKLPEDAYKFLKWFALIALPALATFYGVVAKIWNLPFGVEIVTTITAIGTFIGALIGVSNRNYYKDEEEKDDAGSV